LSGPDKVRSFDDAERAGINCVSLAHLALRELFDYELPPDLFCYEMFKDTRFEAVTPAEMRMGDLVWFGPADIHSALGAFSPEYDESGWMRNWGDCPINHVAIAVDISGGKQFELLHASAQESGVALWSFDQFAAEPRYASVVGASRLAVESVVARSQLAAAS
jgi:cell wall-associated NlpC family hydrolase